MIIRFVNSISICKLNSSRFCFRHWDSYTCNTQIYLSKCICTKKHKMGIHFHWIWSNYRDIFWFLKRLQNTIGEMQKAKEIIKGKTVPWISVQPRQGGNEKFEVKGISSCLSFPFLSKWLLILFDIWARRGGFLPCRYLLNGCVPFCTSDSHSGRRQWASWHW